MNEDHNTDPQTPVNPTPASVAQPQPTPATPQAAPVPTPAPTPATPQVTPTPVTETVPTFVPPQVKPIPVAETTPPNFKHNFKVDGDYTKECKLSTVGPRLNIPSDLKDNIIKALDSIDEEAFDGGDKLWNESHIGAYYNGTMGGTFNKRLEKGRWTSSIKTKDDVIGISSLKTSAGKQKVIKGKEAIYRLMDSLGTGRVGEVPLVHTGIWVKFTPPKEDTITDYYRSISKEKVKLGRFTYGKVFSNMKVIHDDLTMKFILKHVISTSLDISPTDIKGMMDIISPEDSLALQWGLAKSMYPEGVEYDVACGVDPVNCNFLYEGILDVEKLHFMDEANIPSSCIDTLRLTGAGVVTKGDVEVYKRTLWASQKNTCEVETLSGTPLVVKLKHSNLSTQIKIGKQWVESCRSDVHKSLDVSADDDERTDFINSRAKISFLRQYQHYVESIDTGSGIIEGDDISEALTNISASDKSRESLLDGIEEFIESSQYAIVGIPKFECPVCKKTPDSKSDTEGLSESNIKAIIPIDVVQVFFTLIGIKMYRITDRVL